MSYWITVNDELRSKLIQNLITWSKVPNKIHKLYFNKCQEWFNKFCFNWILGLWTWQCQQFKPIFSKEHNESLTILNIFLVGWARERRTKPRLIFTGIVFVKTRGTVSTVSSSSQSCIYPATQMFTATLFPNKLFFSVLNLI